MSDSEETDVFWESWTRTPEKGKRKKESKKENRCLKRKNNMTMKTDENIQKKKKKKNSKCKDAAEGKKEKKRRKKKDRTAVEGDASVMLTQSSSAGKKPHTLPPHSVDQDRKKKRKRKKKVAFDLPPPCVSPKKSVLSENAAVRDAGSSPVSLPGFSYTPATGSQGTSEDMNSQDLFITQKTFRTPQPSSGEASDKALTTSPQGFTAGDELQHLEGPYKCPQGSHSHHRKTSMHTQKTQTLQVLTGEEEEEEEEQFSKAPHDLGKWVKAKLTEEKAASRPAHSVLKAKSERRSRPSSQRSPSRLSRVSSAPPSTSTATPPSTSTSTQTENFFTTELSSYLHFCQQGRVTEHLEDLQPLDLSLPRRARTDPGMCWSLPGEIRGGGHTEPGLHPSGSSDVKDEPSGLHPCTQGQREPGLRTQSEPRSADATPSSEDEPAGRSGKPDLTQVKAVQMRLNESFFFRTKGEGQSPRPESPLMKLAQGRELKHRKH